MKKMQVGRSDVYAPELVLGSFGMGGGTSWQDTTKNDRELIDLIQAAHEIGICGIDTAPVYGMGRSERIVGQAIKADREHYYLSTKCCMQWRNTDGVFQYKRDGKSCYANFRKESLIQDTEESLRRLETDYIDTMIVHRCPPLEEVGEVMETLEALKRRGLIRAIGLSNAGLTDHPIEALETCLQYGELDLVQESASLLNKNNLNDYLRACEKHHVMFQNYSGLEKGALAGKRVSNVASMEGDNRSKYKWFQPEWVEKLDELTTQLQPLAEKYNCSMSVLCLAWLRAQSPAINLLVGARKLTSIQDTIQVLDVELEKEDVEKMSILSDSANRIG